MYATLTLTPSKGYLIRVFDADRYLELVGVVLPAYVDMWPTVGAKLNVFHPKSVILHYVLIGMSENDEDVTMRVRVNLVL